MEGFEAIREQAACLNAEMVAKGADPLNPVSVVHKAIKENDIQLEFLLPGDVGLKGARALYDEQSKTINCEKVDSEIKWVLLVAHELGHAIIHTASTRCAEEDIDVTRPLEASPVGMQRVEDYGPRERRELQANVFAREFVFPRDLAWKLHIEENKGARDISEQTGLPITLVRQQLFDSLLLPKPIETQPRHEDASIAEFQSDESQGRAAAHRGTPFQLQAGPGTGKTHTLIARVISLLDDGIDPSTILVLTFSNRAAGELAERIAASAPEAVQNIWISTFHAFGLDLVRRYHDSLNLPPDPVLFDQSDAIEMLEEQLPTLPLTHYRNLWNPALVLRDIISGISRAKDELCDPKRYRQLATEMHDNAVEEDEKEAAEKCLEVAIIYELYEQAKQAKGAVDFGDLIMLPTLHLESNQGARDALRARHRHILVDEYQDVNRASARLLKTVAGDGKRLWVVGDSRQSIYRFRGASSANMAMFTQDYPDAVADQLSNNYRSTSQIVNTFSTVAPHMGASKEMLVLELQAIRGRGPEAPEIRRYGTLEDEEAGIAASIQELVQKGIPLREQAVLCRTNSRLNKIAAALEARGIPVLYLGSLFERNEIRDLLALLSLAVDPFRNGLVRVGALDRYDLPLQDVHLACHHLLELESATSDGLADLLKLEGLSPKGREGLEQLATDLTGLDYNSSPWDFLSKYLLDRTDTIRKFAQPESVSGRMSAIAVWQFMNFLRERPITGAGLPIKRVLDRVRQLVLLSEDRDLRQVPSCVLHLDAVRLMTVHGSKGLEFEAVHIPGLAKGNFPTSYRGQRCPPPTGMTAGAESLSVSSEARRTHDYEEECLFFVALSRAQTYLRLYRNTRQSSGKKRNPSEFLNWIVGGGIIDHDRPALITLPPGKDLTDTISINWPRMWHVTDNRLMAYDRCPRRFFYTHVLGIGGSRKATAFTKTQDCIYKLIRWVGDERSKGKLSEKKAREVFENVWQAGGPVDHVYSKDYRELTFGMFTALVKSGGQKQFCEPEDLTIQFPDGVVVVRPDEFANLPDGKPVLRRVRTGKRGTNEKSRFEYRLYHLAGQERFGDGGYAVEALHLSSGTEEEVETTPRLLTNSRTKSTAMLKAIRNGEFPPETGSRSCPLCPHFFICSATPQGSLNLPE